MTDPFTANKASTLAFDPLPHMLEYLDEKVAQGRHPKHVRGIRNALAHFSAYVKPLGVVTQYDLDRHHLIRYQGWVNQQEAWKPSYRIELLKRVHAWLNWLEEIGYLDENPWVKIRVGTTKKQPRPLSEEDLALLFDEHRRGALRLPPFTFHRREMILCLLYGWGLRIHELVALDMKDMDVRNDFVICRNKGGGTKTLPYTPEIKRVFNRWAQVRARYADPMVDALLITRNDGGRMDQNHVYKVITDLGEAAGVKINPHRMRDTCGTSLLDADVPAERVQMILGHSRLQQTLAYSRVNNHKVHESAVAAVDPRLRQLLFNRTGELRGAS